MGIKPTSTPMTQKKKGKKKELKIFSLLTHLLTKPPIKKGVGMIKSMG